MQPFPSDGRGIPDERPKRVFRVDEDNHWACDDRLGLADDQVSVQWLRIVRDEGATGPLIPGGTTHWSIGREMVTFKVPGPVSI